MTKREAKRWVCRVAYGMLSGAELSESYTEDFSSEDEQRVESARDELLQELFERGSGSTTRKGE